MKLKILLPFELFAEQDQVSRIVVETPAGSFGLWPHRLDCVAALVPGILSYESREHGEVHVAVDEGVLLKTGADVLVSVRRAIRDADLHRLRASMEREFLALNESERSVRAVMARLEAGVLRRFATLHHD